MLAFSARNSWVYFFRARLKAAQSILSQALRAAEEEYGDVGGWGITGYDEESAIIIADKLKTVMKISLDCGVMDNNGYCAPNSVYKLLNGNDNENMATSTRMYKLVLLNGASVYIRGVKQSPDPDALGSCIVFYVDTNGKAKPNTFGRDMFQFTYYPEGRGLYPIGHPSVSTEATSKSCNKSSSGFGCAYFVLHNENMNYLH